MRTSRSGMNSPLNHASRSFVRTVIVTLPAPVPGAMLEPRRGAVTRGRAQGLDSRFELPNSLGAQGRTAWVRVPDRCPALSYPCCSSGGCGHEDLRLLSPLPLDGRLRQALRPARPDGARRGGPE